MNRRLVGRDPRPKPPSPNVCFEPRLRKAFTVPCHVTEPPRIRRLRNHIKTILVWSLFRCVCAEAPKTRAWMIYLYRNAPFSEKYFSRCSRELSHRVTVNRQHWGSINKGSLKASYKSGNESAISFHQPVLTCLTHTPETCRRPPKGIFFPVLNMHRQCLTWIKVSSLVRFLFLSVWLAASPFSQFGCDRLWHISTNTWRFSKTDRAAHPTKSATCV